MGSVWLARANEWLLPLQSSHWPVISQNNKPQILAVTLGVPHKYTWKDSCKNGLHISMSVAGGVASLD